ncbi:Ferritin [Aquisphaera giovannonii]|uniref:Ferritin n=1 Tax=Aquisphaera giovannonii TaxID=406548 RepID=A0A5B9W436_9BACT|nr:ferritin [Aquisphaera giovannonii]QEH35362.1 Ferritin [Aquisphaera giovannonii]
MLISEKLTEAFNRQIGHELANYLQYQAIANYCEKESLFALARLYSKQADEEREHAMKFNKFLLDAGRSPIIPAVREPRNEFASALEAAQLALDAELATTRQIYDLVELATEGREFIPLNFLQWFLSEQLEEVASAESRLAIIRRAGPSVLMVEAYLVHETK